MPTADSKKEELKFKHVDIVEEGKQIIVPEGMSLREAKIWLERREMEMEEDVGVDESTDAFPTEGAYAFAKAIAKQFGFAQQVPTPSFFGSLPPEMMAVEVDVDTFVSVPWGRIMIPGIAGYLDTGIYREGLRFFFRVGGVVKKKDRKKVADLVKLTRELINTQSIYRGKAIRMAFPKTMDDLNPALAPKFVDTTNTRPDELIFSDEVNRQIQTSLLTPIMRTAKCREYQIPLKRGVLLEGPFGTGKTLTSAVAAKRCVENGWTFIYLKDVNDLQSAIHFARSYQPAVIFAEDIDRAMATDENEDSGRTDKMNEILNTIDGVDTKGMELLVVLTTNHLDLLNEAMMRPGRLDAVINVQPPDAAAVVRLIKLYARGRLDPKDNFDEVGQVLAGHIPAVIREAIERSKLAAVSRLEGDEQLFLRSADLLYAAKEMIRHAELMKPKVEDGRSDIEKGAEVIARALGGDHLSAKPNGHSRTSPTAPGVA